MGLCVTIAVDRLSLHNMKDNQPVFTVKLRAYLIKYNSTFTHRVNKFSIRKQIIDYLLSKLFSGREDYL